MTIDEKVLSSLQRLYRSNSFSAKFSVNLLWQIVILPMLRLLGLKQHKRIKINNEHKIMLLTNTTPNFTSFLNTMKFQLHLEGIKFSSSWLPAYCRKETKHYLALHLPHEITVMGRKGHRLTDFIVPFNISFPLQQHKDNSLKTAIMEYATSLHGNTKFL